MNLKRYIALASLGACALTLPVLGSTKHPVERPMKLQSTITWTVDALTGEGTEAQTGEATHLGRVTDEGWGHWDLANFVILSGGGVTTTASGERLFWVMTPDQLMVVQFTDGTGRFQGATGAVVTTSLTILASEMDWSTLTLTLTITYTMEGTITY